MTHDDDVLGSLPVAPPPAPKRREAAIAVALSRFDGALAPEHKPKTVKAPWPQWLNRPQAGLLAAVALVVAVSLPIAWRSPITTVPADKVRVVSYPARAAPSVQQVAAAPNAVGVVRPPSPAPDSADIVSSPPRSDDRDKAVKPTEIVRAAPAARSPDTDAAQPPTIIVQGRSTPQSLQETPVALSVDSSNEYSSRSEGSIVVIGARIAPTKPLPRGDWNVCTVNDPNPVLSQCGKLAVKAAKAVRNTAETYLAEGLKQAWGGDLDAAISAFDAALAVAPNLSVAYLNRGLAYDRQGDGKAAIADLDRAIVLAPRSARAYYNRSILLRKYGGAERARADEQRAMNLDARYRAILP